MEGLIGKKIGMTSIYDESGANLPCTLIDVTDNIITQIKTQEKDGYIALQVGFGKRKEKNTSKPLAGHLKKSGKELKHKLVEFRKNSEVESLKVGDVLKADVFSEGEFVDVQALSKGKGFQGVVKRHGFSGVGESTHGQHNRLRAPGSIGTGSTPSRVYKGKRMAGRTGGVASTIQNLKVLKVNVEDNTIVLKGAVPGFNGAYVVIKK